MKIKFLHKITAFIICISTLLLLPCISMGAQADYTETIDKLTSLNIIPEKIIASDFVKRKELAKYVCFMLNIEASGLENGGRFYDVKDDEYSGYISYVAALGIMIGTEDGVFEPDKLVTAEIAAKVIINAAGYRSWVDSDNLASYWEYASACKIIGGISCERDGYIKKGELAQMIWNTLDLKAVETDIITNKKNLKKDKLLYYYHKITSGQGLVTANDKTHLKNDDRLNKGYISVDDIIYKAGTDYLADMIGRKIKFYKKEDKNFENGIILWAENKGGDEYIVNGKDVKEVSRNKFICYINDKSKELKLSDVINVIYNGTYFAEFRPEDLMPETGSVELIDADSNREYETAIVHSYIPYVVQGIDAERRIIYNRGTYPNVMIDSEADVIVKYEGRTINFSEIEENDVLLIASNKYYVENEDIFIDYANSEKYEILVSKKVITGKVSEISQDGNYIIINGKGYNIPNDFVNNNNVVINNEATFYIDAFENVVYIKNGFENRRVEGTYGYVTKVIFDSAREETVSVRIFDEYGKWNTYNLASRTKIDGISAKTSEAMYNLLCMGNDAKLPGGTGGQMIVFRLNDEGNINFVDTARVSDKEISEYTFEISMPITYAQYYNNAFERKVIIDTAGNNVLEVPQRSSSDTDYDPNNEEQYRWINGNEFSDGNRYYIQAYNSNEYNKAEKFVYLRNPSQMPTSDNYPVIITKKIQTVDYNDEIITRLNVMGSNGASTVDIYTDTAIVNLNDTSKKLKVDNLNVGDIINYSSNNNGKATAISKKFSLYGADGKITPYASEYGDDAYYSSMNMVFGNLYAINSDSVSILCSDDEREKDQIYSYYLSGIKIIFCDMKNLKNISQISFDQAHDILKTKTASTADKVFINCKYGICNTIFIYRLN